MKTFFKRLFCKHTWYVADESQTGRLVIKEHKCSKCQKSKIRLY